MKAILILSMLTYFSLSANCQTMTIQMKNGNKTNYLIRDIEKITYSESSTTSTIDDYDYQFPEDGNDVFFNGTSTYYKADSKVLVSSDFSFEIILMNNANSQRLDATIFSNQNDNNLYGLVFANRSSNSNGYSIFYGDGVGSRNWIGIDIDKFSIPTNQWTHYVFVKKLNITTLYENGNIKYQRQQNSSKANFATSPPLTFGTYSGYPNTNFGSRFWAGKIRLVRFWNRPLTDSEVKTLFQ